MIGFILFFSIGNKDKNSLCVIYIISTSNQIILFWDKKKVTVKAEAQLKGKIFTGEHFNCF